MTTITASLITSLSTETQLKNYPSPSQHYQSIIISTLLTTKFYPALLGTQHFRNQRFRPPDSKIASKPPQIFKLPFATISTGPWPTFKTANSQDHRDTRKPSKLRVRANILCSGICFYQMFIPAGRFHKRP